MLLVAPAKAGKTTLIASLLRSLIDGDPFLGRAEVAPVDGSVALVDLEMPPLLLDDWLRARRIHGDDRIVPIPLRGVVSTFDLLDHARRREWVAWLRARNVRYLVLDCVRPVLDVLGLEESREAGRFLVAFDALLVEAGIGEACVVHHMGHLNERARGDSRLIDWPDVTWRLLWPRAEDGQEAGARYIAAFGRDVDHPESLLATTRRRAGSPSSAGRDTPLRRRRRPWSWRPRRRPRRWSSARCSRPRRRRSRCAPSNARCKSRASIAARRFGKPFGKVSRPAWSSRWPGHAGRSCTEGRPDSQCAGLRRAVPAQSPPAHSSAPVRHHPYRGGAVAQWDGPGEVDPNHEAVPAQSPGARAPVDPWAGLGWPPGSEEAAARAEQRLKDHARHPRGRR